MVRDFSDRKDPGDQVVSKDQKVGTVRDFKDLLRGVPALSMTEQRGVQSIFLRGASSEHVLVLLDGMPINDLTSPTGAFDSSMIDPSLIEVVVVKPGSQSVLYGSGALGGVIDIRTRRPHGTRGGRLGLTGGDRHELHSEASAWHGGKDLEGTVAYSKSEAQAFSAASSGKELDRTEKHSFFTRADWRINESHSWGLQTFKRWGRLEYDQGTTPPSDDPNAFQIFDSAMARTYYKFQTDASFQSTFHYTYNRFERLEDDAPNPADAFPYGHWDRGDSWVQRIGNHSQWFVNEKWFWELGFDAHQEKIKFRTIDTSFIFSEIDQQFDRQAAFSRLRYGDPKDWTLTPGLRSDCEGSECFYPFSMDLEVGDQNKFFLQWASGEKRPTAYQRYVGDIYTVGNPLLKNEKVLSLRLGTALSQTQNESQFFQKFEIYESRFTDLVEYKSATLPIRGTYQNVSSAQSRGWEFGMGAIFTAYSVSGAWGFNEAKNQVTGQDLIRRPRTKGNLNFTWTPSKRYRNSLEGNYKGSVVDSVGGTRTSLKDYTVFSWDQEYIFFADNTEWILSLSVRNLFDEMYEDVRGYSTPERGYFFGLEARF